MRIVLLTIVGAAALAGGAVARPAATHHLAWHETWLTQGKPFLTFDVTSITITSTAWSAHVAVHNRSPFRLVVPAQLFQLAVYESPRPPNCRAYVPLRGSTPVPPPPAAIAAGATWRTTFGGPHGLDAPQKGWVRVVFAYFKGGPTPSMRTTRFGWITDHVLSLATGRSVRKSLPC